jgi:TPR repeat protein
MRKILATLLLGLIVGGGVVRSGPYEDAIAARARGDFATELRLLRPLAERGNADAQSDLGDLYFLGVGVTRDYREAAKWYRLSAEGGNADAQRVAKRLTPAQVVRAQEMARQCEARSYKNSE